MEEQKNNGNHTIHNHFAEGSNCQVFNAPISNAIFAMPGSHVTQVAAKADEQTKSEAEMMDADLLDKAVKGVREYIWGNAAYAVPFCVIRDGFKGNGNASNYERQLANEGIVIPPGTINAAMSRNPWMKYHCDNWEQNGASERALKLRDFFKQMVSEAAAREVENELPEEVHP